METVNVSLPSGIRAVLKAWLTGRDKQKLRAVFLKDVEISTNELGKPSTSGVKGSVVEEAENLAISLVLIELDGSAENILSRALDLRADDFDALLKAINEVTSDKRFLAK